MISKAHRAALRLLVARLPAEELNWALTGSTGHALQGVPVKANDIDVQTDEDTVWKAADLLAEHCVSPPHLWESTAVRSLFGRYAIEGVHVELIGALQKRLPDGGWGPPADPSAHRRFVAVERVRVPVLDLGYEARAYLELGRHGRAALLRRHLRDREQSGEP